MKLSVAVGCCLLVALARAEHYHEFQVFVVHPESQEQLGKLLQWRNHADVDFWDAPKLNRDARVMLGRSGRKEFLAFLDRADIEYDLAIEDVQDATCSTTNATKRDSNSKATIDFDHFWTLAEIYEYLDELQLAYGNLVRVVDIGTTYENRPIKAVTISTNGGAIDQTRPIVFMDAGIHAREWAGVMSVMYMIHEFVEHSENYGDQLANTDYVIIPVLNPDGFEYTHTRNRLWRKNRAPSNILCYGIDLNRNFPYQWEYTSSVCTNTYAGTAGSSERETAAMMALMDQYKAAVKLYLAVHTYGELILWPWGYDFLHVPNGDDLQTLGEAARDAVVAVGGPTFEVGNSADILYIASGASDDYAYSVGVLHAYTLELTGGGDEGFDLPANQLPKVASETFEMFKVFGRHAATL